MDQTRSASAGVGSLLNVGVVSNRQVSVVEAPVSGVLNGPAAAIPMAFDKSMQQAQQQRAQSSESILSGQSLPDGGRLLPRVSSDLDTAAQAQMLGVQEIVETVAEAVAESGELVEQRRQSKQQADATLPLDLAPSLSSELAAEDQAEFNSALKSEFHAEHQTASNIIGMPSTEMRVADNTETVALGDATLQQIDQSRQVDLAVASDSALQRFVRMPDRVGELLSSSEPKALSTLTESTTANTLSTVAQTAVSPMVNESLAESDLGRVQSGVISESMLQGSMDSALAMESADELTGAGLNAKADVGLASGRAESGSMPLAETKMRWATTELNNLQSLRQSSDLAQLLSPLGPVTTQPPGQLAGQVAGQSMGQFVNQVDPLADIRMKLAVDGAEKSSGIELGSRLESRSENMLTSFADSLAAAKPGRSVEVPSMVMPNGVRPGTPSWGTAVNDRVMLMASKNGQFAEIQLDPPELGSLQVKLQVKNEQVSVVFNTPHSSVRDALEQNMPRLREMFAEMGLNLSESSVEDQSSGQQKGESGTETALAGYRSDSVDDTPVESRVTKSLSLVDYYA